MLLSRVHWATHLLWAHTLRNHMIFQRKNGKCIISVFNQTVPQLDAYGFHCFCLAEWRERGHDQRCTWLTQHFDLNLSMFWIPGLVSVKGFQRRMKARLDQPVWLALYLGRMTLWLSQEFVYAWSISSREATMFLAGRRQSIGNHIPWYTAITWCLVN